MTDLSVPIHREKGPRKRWLAIIAGLGGVLVILQPWGGGSFSLSVVTVRTLGRGNSSMSMVFWYLLLVSVGSGVLAIGDWRPLLAADKDG